MLKKICIISYSSRKNGNCSRTAEYIAHAFEKSSRLYQISEVCFSDINFHICGHCDYECFHDMCKYDNDDICQIYRTMLESDLILQVIPIYGGLPCSNYFIMNERAQGALHGDEYEKLEHIRNKYVIIGNTGTEITKDIIYQSAGKLSEEDFLVLRSNDVGERSYKGNLMEYNYYQEQMDGFLAAIIKEG